MADITNDTPSNYGGKRKHAGRKKVFNCEMKTLSTKVPKAIHQELLDYVNERKAEFKT